MWTTGTPPPGDPRFNATRGHRQNRRERLSHVDNLAQAPGGPPDSTLPGRADRNLNLKPPQQNLWTASPTVDNHPGAPRVPRSGRPPTDTRCPPEAVWTGGGKRNGPRPAGSRPRSTVRITAR